MVVRPLDVASLTAEKNKTKKTVGADVYNRFLSVKDDLERAASRILERLRSAAVRKPQSKSYTDRMTMVEVVALVPCSQQVRSPPEMTLARQARTWSIE